MTLLPGASSHRSFAYQRDRFPLSYKLQKFLLPKLTHLVLVCFIVIVVYSEAKELHRSSAQTWFFLTAHVTTMLCFFLAASLDPGYVSRESVRDVLESLGSSSPSRNGKSSSSAADLESDSSCSEDEVFLQSREFSKKPLVSNPPRLSYKNKPVSFRKCNYCEMLQPLRAKHCEECGRCVRKYDHHCPWLGNCVGEKNHKFFWALLSTGAITVCYTLNLTYHAFHSPPSATIPEYVRLNVLLIIVFVLEALFLFFDLVLLGAHTYLMASNQTSWEFMARSRITYLRDLSSEDNPFDRGLVRNCWQFLCNWRASNWESYFTNLSSTVNTCVSSVIQTGQGVAAAACNPSMTTPHYYSKLETNDYDEQEHQIPSEGQRRGFSVQKPSSSVNSLAPELIGDESSSESSTGNKTSSKWNEANNSSLSYSVVNVEGNEDGFAEVNVDDSGHGGSSDLNCSNI